ncbi:MAG: UvrD-helicase domain-containing protein [Puniceicoccales bacterium]|nr:UvrD-helicase domain-containing protein [Puniceicoccales bacterium]
MDVRIDHEAILASAGSGKTYQLSNRIVRLLACGADPGGILALTFTRKAAGEFVRRTLAKLAAAAANDTAALKLARELELPASAPQSAVAFNALLAKTVDGLHRMQMSTLDSFYQRLVRMAFFELGMAGSVALLDERLAGEAKARVLRRIFRRDATSNTAHKDFLAAFRLATWGREARGVTHQLEQFTDSALRLLHEFPAPELWDGSAALSGGSGLWLPAPGQETLQAALAVLDTFALANATGVRGPGAALQRFAGAVRSWDAGQPLSSLGSFFENSLLPIAPGLLSGGPVTLPYNRKTVELPPPVVDALAVALRHTLGGILERCTQVTRGVHALLRQYDDTYERLVRRAGHLTFDDMADALTGWRLQNTAYRLDAVTRHWLFDEFQDTSRRDWRVLEENVSEVLSEDSGERSVFLVGDPKQALYGWRGGEHALLGHICDHYSLPRRRLNSSWRSSPAVLDMANAVFGSLKAAKGILPDAALSEWEAVWREHSASGDAQARPGWSAWLICEKEGRRADSEESVARRLAAVVALLRRARPFSRGLTCALLTQTNAEALDAARLLRAQGIRITSETDMPIAEDNPVTRSLLALLAAAAHPGDGFFAGAVASTPALAAWVEQCGGAVAAHAVLREGLAEHGFAGALQIVLSGLPDLASLDEFSTRRLEQLLAIAREFDASGGRDTDDFILFAQRSRRRDASGADSVQVMTVHKAKGLEFDFVFLPFLEGVRLDSARKSSFLSSEMRPGAAAWVLANPGNLVCEYTPGLDANLTERKASACYEKLCVLYVALTRARHATCVITTGATKERDSDEGANFPQLLDLTLGGGSHSGASAPPTGEEACGVEAWASGDPAWFEKIPEKPVCADGVPVAAVAREEPLLPPFTPRRFTEHQSPSEAGDFELPAASLFTGVRGHGASLGRCIHALLASVPFFDEGGAAAAMRDLEPVAAAMAGVFGAEIVAEAFALLRESLSAAALHAVFAKPDSGAALWREQAFSVILDGVWVSGVFDRVVFGNGEAWIYDFKTDAESSSDELIKRHAGQLSLYRGALRKLTGISAAKLHSRLVHLPSGQVLEVA